MITEDLEGLVPKSSDARGAPNLCYPIVQTQMRKLYRVRTHGDAQEGFSAYKRRSSLPGKGWALNCPEHQDVPIGESWTDSSTSGTISTLKYRRGTRDLAALVPGKVFDNPKPVQLIRRGLEHASGDDIILDFFAGPGTGEAVLQHNAEDGRSRRYRTRSRT